MAPQGTFEGRTGTWTRTGGAAVVNDQAPWRINGGNHGKASQACCVAANEESLRFFYESPGSGSISSAWKCGTWLVDDVMATPGSPADPYRYGSGTPSLATTMR